MRNTIHRNMAVKYRRQILNADGSLAFRSKWKKNLMLDGGLDLMADDSPAKCINYCAIGSGNSPTNRDSGLITFTRSGTTVTASAGFFVSSDTGRLLKFDSGEEVYITYVDTTHVTTAGSGAIAASQGTVWYVNDVGHQTELKRSNTYSTGTNECQSTISGNTITHKETYLFSAETGSVTYKEIGWSPNASGQLTGRDVFAGDSLVAGQQYKVTVQLIVTYTPSVSTAQPDVGNNGFNTSGNCCVEEFSSRTLTTVNSSGGSGLSLGTVLDTSWDVGSASMALYTADFTLSPISSPVSTVAGATNSSPVISAYTPGSFFRDCTFTYGVSQGNSNTIYGMGIYENQAGRRGFTIKFASLQTKLNTHSLTVTWRQSWGRTLVN